MMKKKMMAAGGNMKKKMMSAGGTMKKKMMSAGGMPMAKDPKTGKMMPTFAMDGKGKMMKGGMSMKKKGYAAGGATSSYDLADRMYPGGGQTKASPTKARAKKKPVVTKAMITKAGATSLRDFYNKMEVNAAGTGYKKRSKALTKRGTSSAPKSKSRKSTMSQANPKLKFGTRSRSGTTVKPKKRKAGPMGNPLGLTTLMSNLFGEKRDARLKEEAIDLKRRKDARRKKLAKKDK